LRDHRRRIHSSAITLDLEAVELCWLVGSNARLLPSNGHLVFHRVYSLQIGQQESTPPVTLDDHPVTPGIQFLRPGDRFRRGQDIYFDLQIHQLVRTETGEARITGGGGDGVFDDLLGYAVPEGLNGTDASA
jgi:hypothetical protein